MPATRQRKAAATSRTKAMKTLLSESSDNESASGASTLTSNANKRNARRKNNAKSAIISGSVDDESFVPLKSAPRARKGRPSRNSSSVNGDVHTTTPSTSAVATANNNDKKRTRPQLTRLLPSSESPRTRTHTRPQLTKLSSMSPDPIGKLSSLPVIVLSSGDESQNAPLAALNSNASDNEKNASGEFESVNDDTTQTRSPDRLLSRAKRNSAVVRVQPVSTNHSSLKSDSEEEAPLCKTTIRRARGKQVREKLHSSDSDSDEKTVKCKANGRSAKRGRKCKVIKSSDEESGKSDAPSASEASEDEELKRVTRTRGRRKVRVDSDEKSDSDDEEEKKNKKKRRRIREDHELSQTTKEAAKAEEERLKRLAERQLEFNGIVTAEGEGERSGAIERVIFDRFKEDDKEAVIEVDSRLARHLKPHQASGVQFMFNAVVESFAKVKEDAKTEPKDDEHAKVDLAKKASPTGTGCILAHSMGLGKTLQTIALIHTLLTDEHLRKFFTHVLVVCPKNVISAWSAEFTKWLDFDEDEEVFVFDAQTCPTKKQRVTLLEEWVEIGGVLLSTYNMYQLYVVDDDIKPKPSAKVAARIAARDAKLTKKQRRIREERRRLVQKTRPMLTLVPDLVVCDEGHKLKNEKTMINAAMTLQRTKRRICLTGTPLQNRLDEYYVMLQFTRPNLLGTRAEFRNRFATPIENGQTKDASQYDVDMMRRRTHVLYKLLENVVQRRDWVQVLKELPEGLLPPKHEYIISCRQSDTQVKLYQRYLDECVGRTEDAANLRERILYDFHWFSRIAIHPTALEIHRIDMERKDLRRLEREDDRNFIDDNSNESEVTTDSDDNVVETKSRNNRDKDEDDDDVEGEQERAATPEEYSRDDWWIKSELVKDENKFNFLESGKMCVLLSLMKKCENVGDKLLIFSQRVETLNYIEMCFQHFVQEPQRWRDIGDNETSVADESYSFIKRIDYDRIDGSRGTAERNSIMNEFNDKTNLRMRFLLMTTGAGGIGVTLTGANRVVLFDASWNPAQDLQAIFRIYRFGQTKPCYIYRLIAQGCMEERIYDRSATKQAMSLRVVDAEQVPRHFTQSDIREMYRFEPIALNPDVLANRPKGAVPDDKLLADVMLELGRYCNGQRSGESEQSTSGQDNHNWIVSVMAHDSLFDVDAEDKLTEEEQERAWQEYKNERNGLRVQRPIVVSDMAAYQMAISNEQFPSTEEAFNKSTFVMQLRMKFMQLQALDPTVYMLSPEGWKAGMNRLGFESFIHPRVLQLVTRILELEQGPDADAIAMEFLETLRATISSVSSLSQLYAVNNNIYQHMRECLIGATTHALAQPSTSNMPS